MLRLRVRREELFPHIPWGVQPENQVTGGGLNEKFPAYAEKKRSSQASWKHAAWELLSPDLRCFCTHHVRELIILQEYLRALAFSNKGDQSLVTACLARASPSPSSGACDTKAWLRGDVDSLMRLADPVLRISRAT